jgi:hypothetical protein
VKTSIKRASELYSTGNQAAARLIAADPVAYPLGGLMREWAQAVLNRTTGLQVAKAGLLRTEAPCE